MNRRNGLAVPVLAAAVIGTLLFPASCGRRQPSAQPPPSPSVTATGAPSTTPTLAPSASPSQSRSPSPTPTRSPSTSPTDKPTPTATTPTGPPPVPASLRGKDIEVIPTSRRIVALTFDGGANADGLASILATLDKEGVKATFFLTGEFATKYPASVKAIVARGHRLGNHTATHPHLPALPNDAAVVNQLKLAETQIRAAGGTDPEAPVPVPVRRPQQPHHRGRERDRVCGGALDRRLVGLEGNLGGISAQIVVDRVVNAACPGEVVLMHVGSTPRTIRRSTLRRCRP